MPVVIPGSGGGGNDLNRQITNKQTRLSAVGVNPNPDPRNAVEKFLNLPKNQNAFFDILDILGRPQQAVFNLADDQLRGRNTNPLDSLARGLSGKREVHGQDLLKTMGIDSFGGGLALDLLADPINLIPGTAIAKTLKAPVNLAGSLSSGTIKALDKYAPNLEAGQKVEDFLKLFNRDRGKSQEFIDRRNQMEADMTFYGKKVMDQNLKAANKAGLDNGVQVGREMEKDLPVNYDPLDILKRLTANRPNQNLQVNMISPEMQKFVDDINSNIKNSQEFKDRLAKEKAKLDSVNAELAKTFSKYNIPDIAQRIKSGQNVTKLEQKIFQGVQTKNRKKKEFESFIKNFKPGIKINPLDTIIDDVTGKKRPRGYNFELSNPGIFRQVIGKDKGSFLDDISPKKTFDQATGGDPNVRQVAEAMMRSGRVSLPKSNQSSYQIAEDLKRVLGNNVRLHTNGPRNVVVELTKKGRQDLGTQPIDQWEFPDRIQNIAGQRPDRDYIDPINGTKAERTIHATAQQMLNSNKELHSLAQANNLELGELQGYMTHIWSQEQKAKHAKATTSGTSAMGGNKSVTRERQYQGSAEDINELKDEDFFQMNAFFATAIGQKRLSEYIIAESFKRDVLEMYVPKDVKGNLIPYTGGPVPKTHVVITPDKYDFFKTDGGQVSIKQGESYVVPRDISQELDRLNGRIKDDGINNFVKGYDKLLNTWKNFVLLSPGYHVRNDLGSGFNMWVAGMNVASIAKYKTLAAGDVVRYSKVYAKTSGKLPSHGGYKYYDEFRRHGMLGTSFAEAEFRFASDAQEEAFMKALEKGDESAIKKLMPQNWFRTSQEIAQFVDSTNKFAMYRWLREKGVAPDKAKAKVLETLFDYNDLTEFERKIVKRIIPFYTWMKKNAVFQVKNFLDQPKKYYNFNKLLDAAYEETGVNQDDVPEWMRDNMYIPFMKGDKKGDAQFFNAGLPAADLGKLTDPLKMLVEGLSPAFKMPYEWNANHNSFTGRPIEEFEGQTKNLLGVDLPAKLDYLLRGFGLPNTLDRAINGEGDPTGMSRYFDAEKAKTSQMFDINKALDDMMKKYTQDTGKRVPTLQDLGR